mmetsp:Transcript_22583/g.49412  ORF Transcript_22583/g.49412 Transcript_22583/m.49412 type:complete len:236 (+) Transcript_22583:3359-4066(+)
MLPLHLHRCQHNCCRSNASLGMPYRHRYMRVGTQHPLRQHDAAPSRQVRGHRHQLHLLLLLVYVRRLMLLHGRGLNAALWRCVQEIWGAGSVLMTIQAAMFPGPATAMTTTMLLLLTNGPCGDSFQLQGHPRVLHQGLLCCIKRLPGGHERRAAGGLLGGWQLLAGGRGDEAKQLERLLSGADELLHDGQLVLEREQAFHGLHCRHLCTCVWLVVLHCAARSCATGGGRVTATIF